MYKHPRLAINILLVFLPIQAISGDPFYCSSSELTACLGITQTECKQAAEKALELCSNKYNLDFDKNIDESKNIINKISSCSTKQFWLLTSVTDKDVKRCDPLFIKVIDIEVEKLKKQKERADNCFFKDDDDPCNYRK